MREWIDLTESLTTLIPDVGTLLELPDRNGETRRYVVAGWLKDAGIEDAEDDDLFDLDDIHDQSVGKHGPDHKRLVYCPRKNAEYLMVKGQGSTVIRVGEGTVVGRAPQMKIDELRSRVARLIGRLYGS